MEKANQKSQDFGNKSTEIVKRGKQSLDSMMKDGSQLTNIEITDRNIRSFERIARKYSIDYSLKKDKAVSPPRYLVFSGQGIRM